MNLETQNLTNSTPQTEKTSHAWVPPWLLYSLTGMFFYGVWGIQSKVVTEHVSPLANQVLSTPGLLLVTLALWLRRDQPVAGSNRVRWQGILFALLTGILGAAGNVTFYEALRQGSKASVIVPLTTLYPMVTVVMALALLKERINGYQIAGIGLAIAAIVILGG
ncbi:MAG: DMT family transporter [Acidobacteriota bacterium]